MQLKRLTGWRDASRGRRQLSRMWTLMCERRFMTDRDPLYRRHRFSAEIIAHAVWLYFRFPLTLQMVEDLLAARGITVSYQTVRLWAEKFGRAFANKIRRWFSFKAAKSETPDAQAVDRTRSLTACDDH